MAGHSNKLKLRAARAEAGAAAVAGVRNVDPAEALQEVLDRAVSVFRHAAAKVDRLAEDEMTVMTAVGPMPNEWVRLEDRMRMEIEHISANMIKNGLAERLVRVREAQTEVMLRYILQSAAQAGIGRDELRRLGPALRANVHMLEGGAPDAPLEAAA